MNDQTELILIACLDRLELGDSIDKLLQQYPDVAAELRPVLETAVLMNQLAISPTLAAREKSKKEMLAHAETLRSPKTRPVSWANRLRRVLLPVASLALLLVMLGAVLVPVSASALPGDTLYGLKRQVETFQLWRTSDPDTLLDLVETLRDERHREIEALLRGNRDAVVDLEGTVETKNEATWQVAGFAVQITAVTELSGNPEVGDSVLINGHTSSGHLFADKIIVHSDNSQPIVAPTATHTPQATATPAATRTSSPTTTATTTATPTVTATPSATPTATPTSTLEPTVTLTATSLPTLPPPTATPDSNDNSNDNDNDNSGSNDNDNDNDNSNDNGDDNSGSNNNGNDNDDEDNSGKGNNNNNDNDNDNDNDNEDNSGKGNNNNDNDNDNE